MELGRDGRASRELFDRDAGVEAMRWLVVGLRFDGERYGRQLDRQCVERIAFVGADEDAEQIADQRVLGADVCGERGTHAEHEPLGRHAQQPRRGRYD